VGALGREGSRGCDRELYTSHRLHQIEGIELLVATNNDLLDDLRAIVVVVGNVHRGARDRDTVEELRKLLL
jgi:hypothetical protein